MGSFALYSQWESDHGQQTCENALSADIHFNLWSVSATSQSFLDIGIMLKGLEPKQSIFLYVPFAVEEKDITDLGALLSKDKRLLAAVFNENYTLVQRSKPKWADVEKVRMKINRKVV